MYDDELDTLAAEYVLGTLSAEERAHAETLLEIDAAFVNMVRQWERRLGELNVMVEAVEPPPEVWQRIKAGIGGAAPATGIAPEAGTGTGIAPEGASEIGIAPESESENASGTIPEIGGFEPLDQIHLVPFDEPASPPPPQAPAQPSLLLPPLPGAEPDAAMGGEPPSPIGAPASGVLPPEDEPAAAGTTAEPMPASPGTAGPTSPSSRGERTAEVIELRHRVNRWRLITLAVGAVAAALTVHIALSEFALSLVMQSQYPFVRVVARSPGGLAPAPAPVPIPLAPAPAPAPPQGPRLIAVLQQDPTSPAFLLTVDVATKTMTVRRVVAAPEAGRSYELWLISSKFPAPRSLGVIGAQEFTQRPLAADFDAATVRAASYAISFEPAGGSPTGIPTGPILFTGRLLEAVPAAGPPPT